MSHTPRTDAVTKELYDYCGFYYAAISLARSLERDLTKATAGVKIALRNSQCPFCGRDNRGYEHEGCTADDCPGVELLEELKQ